MLVFLALNVNSRAIEERVIEWRSSDRESIQWQRVIDKLPPSRRLKRIGSLPGRLLLILEVILLTSIPLSQSLGQLRNEIVYKQQETQLRNTATEVWQNNLATLSDGQAKSYIRQLVLKEQSCQLLVQLQVFSNEIYTEAEKENYRRLLSEKLSRPVESIALSLVEIPTASNDLVRKDTKEQIPSAPTIPEIQAELLKAIAPLLLIHSTQLELRQYPMTSRLFAIVFFSDIARLTPNFNRRALVFDDTDRSLKECESSLS